MFCYQKKLGLFSIQVCSWGGFSGFSAVATKPAGKSISVQNLHIILIIAIDLTSF